MRRAGQLLAVLCVAALVMTLCGCGGSGSPTGRSVDTAAAGGNPGRPDKPPKPPPEEPEPPADPAIAFVIDYEELWVMNADGTNRTRLVGDASVRSPSWSPDGESLVFLNAGDTTLQGWGLYVVSVSVVEGAVRAGDPQILVAGPDPKTPKSPAWSPLGDCIAYTWFDDYRDPNDYGEIRAISPDGGPPETLYEFSDPFVPLGGVSWSPQADRLTVEVFNGDWLPDYSGVRSFIGILDLAGGTLTDVTGPAGFDGVGGDSAEWARLSDRIIFSGAKVEEDSGGLWILDLEQTDPSLRFRKLVYGRVKSWLEWPSWSPDDTRLVASNHTDLWLVDVETGELTVLAKRQRGGDLRFPDWRRF